MPVVEVVETLEDDNANVDVGVDDAAIDDDAVELVSFGAPIVEVDPAVLRAEVLEVCPIVAAMDVKSEATTETTLASSAPMEVISAPMDVIAA